jgi:hypothetical protein
MPDYRHLDRLIQEANRTVARKPDSVEILAQMIGLLGDDGGDPYLILGVLVEGAVQTLAKHVAAERQAETARALAQLLTDRLRQRGLV